MPDVLPERYQFAYDYCMFLHDLLAQIVVEGGNAEIFHTEIEFSNDAERDSFEASDDADIFEWLEKNNKIEYVAAISHKMAVQALISDFCHYVYEGLTCARKGKLAPAFTLFRKPFCENLFYFEWMLSDPAGFAKAFIAESPEQIQIDKAFGQPEKKQKLIEESISCCGFPECFDAELIYELRYDKKAEHGLQTYFQHSTHLITIQNKHLKSAPQNFNMIFCGQEEYEEQWEFIFVRLPYLLLYAVEVVEAIVERFAPTHPDYVPFMQLRRMAGFLLLGQRDSSDEGFEARAAFVDTLQEHFSECPHCASKRQFNEKDLHGIYERGEAFCGICKKNIFEQDYTTPSQGEIDE